MAGLHATLVSYNCVTLKFDVLQDIRKQVVAVVMQETVANDDDVYFAVGVSHSATTTSPCTFCVVISTLVTVMEKT